MTEDEPVSACNAELYVDAWTDVLDPTCTIDHCIIDPYGYPLTWHSILDAHSLLAQHRQCEARWAAAQGSTRLGAPCPCTYHPMMDDRLAEARMTLDSAPGAICTECYRSSCSWCGYVFSHYAEAAIHMDFMRQGQQACPSCASLGLYYGGGGGGGGGEGA